MKKPHTSELEDAINNATMAILRVTVDFPSPNHTVTYHNVMQIIRQFAKALVPDEPKPNIKTPEHRSSIPFYNLEHPKRPPPDTP